MKTTKQERGNKNMKSKKMITKVLLLAFVISLVLPAGAFAAETRTASDLQGHWAESVISQWMTDGLVGGYQDGTFQPDKSITRAEFVKLVNAAVKPNKVGAVNFSDVTNTDWFYDELRLAMGAGYVGGFEDGTFRPADNVTRAQAAAFIAKAKGLTQDTAQANKFADSAAIADWAKGAVGAVVKAGYMGGYQDGTFRADNALTRAEAVSMLDRVLKDQSDDLVITEPGTVVKDKTVAGDVIIAASVGSGDVTLDNVTIHGDLLVKGGGANSVHLKNTTVKGTVYAQRTAGTVRVVVEAASHIDRIVILNGTQLQAASDFKGMIKEIIIDEQASSTQAITIDAKADKIEIQANVDVTIKEDAKQVVLTDTADKADVTITDSAKVDSLVVNAEKSTVKIASGAKVETLTANEAVDINGSGSIGKLEANASNVTTEIKPDKTETASGVKDPVIDTTVSGGGSSSGGSSGGGGTTVKTATVTTAEELTKALEDTTVDVVKVSGTIGSDSAYGTYTVDRVVTIKSDAKATVFGSFVVKADGVVFDNLTINNKYEDANTANKNGISAYADKLTVTNCIFNANAVNGTYEPNGLVIFPKTAGANGYTITGNTFNGFNNVANGAMYHSAGVFVAEGYPVNKKDFFGVKEATLSATVAAGVDEAIAEKNTFTNCAYGYVRMNEFGAEGAGVHVCYATVGNEAVLNNAIMYAAAQETVVLDDDITLTQMVTIKDGKSLTLVLNGHVITNGITYSENVIRMFSFQGSYVTIDGTVNGSAITTGYTDEPNQEQMRLIQNLNGTLIVNGGSYTGYYAFESNEEDSTVAATTTISDATITAGFCALSNFAYGTMNVSNSTITADYYVLANNGLHGNTHFNAKDCTMTSKLDTAIYFPAGDTLVIDGGTINASNGSGIEAFAGNVEVKGNAIINAGANVAKTDIVSAAGEGSRMDGSAILAGYRKGYMTTGALNLTVESGVTLNSTNNGTIRLVQLGALQNGITAITVSCPADMVVEDSQFINNIPADTTLTVTINDEQVRPVKEQTETKAQAAQDNSIVNDEANTDPANDDKDQAGKDTENGGKDSSVNGAGGADTPDISNTSANEAAGEGSTDVPAETPAE